jgi:hypothetical protein
MFIAAEVRKQDPDQIQELTTVREASTALAALCGPKCIKMRTSNDETPAVTSKVVQEAIYRCGNLVTRETWFKVLT